MTNLMTTDLLSGLNPKQKEAVLHTEGPLLILAGAGSGKTRVIAHRIAYLVEVLGIPLETILAVTFTNKAAGEMRDRVLSLLSQKAERGNLLTFHSICLKILRQHAHLIGLKNDFVIYDTQDQAAMMKSVLSDLVIDDAVYPPKRFLGLISQLKNQLISPEQYAEGRSASTLQEKLKQVYPFYQQKLRAASAVDFDDLIGLTIQLFQTQPDLLARFRDRFQYLMIDEYQDTNYAQYLLTRFWVGERRNICVVGDDDQSIYAFRGADVGNILKFERDYPDAKVVVLDQNYRSTEAILSAAGAVISKNQTRKAKVLWTEKGMGEPILVTEVEDEMGEARFVRETIEKGLRDRQPLSDFCILYRTHAQSRVLEEQLRNQGIPYLIFGGIRFYERREIKDLIAYLRLIFSPEDHVSLRRVINTPPRGLGEVTLQRLHLFAESEGITLHETIHRVVVENDEGAGVTRAGKQGLTTFYRLIERMRDEMQKMPLGDLVRLLVEQTDYINYIREGGETEEKGDKPEGRDAGASREENVLEFISAAEQFTMEGATTPPGNEELYKGFLDQIALIANEEGNKSKDAEGFVTLMTIHSAKGLEFESVFMVGMEEGIFPHARALTEPKEMEEERRLCYVGMTRAKSRLYLTSANSRRLYGTTQWNLPSRFIKDLGEKGIKRVMMHSNSGPASWDAPSYSSEGRYKKSVDRTPIDSDRYENEWEEKSQEKGAYAPGALVRHPIFGVGQVQQCNGSEKITIRFSSVGIKKLALKYAKLERV
jgi:DNA helicase-2/ATP-dependent DNA helicase PcrA